MKRMICLMTLWAVLCAAAPADDFDRAVSALRAGLHAEQSGNLPATERAATAIAVLGMHPLDGAEDLAAGWAGDHAVPYRERVLGPAYLGVMLPPGGRYALEQSFLAGRRARVAAFSTIATRFQLQVHDGERARSCGMHDGTANCDWVPVFTGRVRVELMNAGRKPAKFVIVMQ